MQLYRTWAHTKYDLKAHIVFVPKYRKRILFWDIAQELRSYIRQICDENDVKILSGKLAVDHVHLFVSYPTTISISKLVQRIKWKSSYKLQQNNKDVKKQYRAWHFRARWYLAVSSWSITDEMIAAYIDEQEWLEVQDNFEIIGGL